MIGARESTTWSRFRHKNLTDDVVGIDDYAAAIQHR